MWLDSLAGGRFAAAAAALRPQAISPNIIVFVVHGLTFVNASAHIWACLICLMKESMIRPHLSAQVAYDQGATEIKRHRRWDPNEAGRMPPHLGA